MLETINPYLMQVDFTQLVEVIFRYSVVQEQRVYIWKVRSESHRYNKESFGLDFSIF